jgi:CDGSH-type Zn-finger protein
MTTKNVSLAVEVQAGSTYLWCRCGLTKTPPLCDFAHKTGATEQKPLSFVADKTGTVYLCSCQRSDDAPYCDGFNCDK